MRPGTSVALAISTAFRYSFHSVWNSSFREAVRTSVTLFALPLNSSATSTNHLLRRLSSTSHNLDSLTTINNMTSSDMRRGQGGRIEDAFAAAKDRGEAAFVSFVTAGYPNPEG